ncbi:sensor histidine kinase [Paenibacillus sp. J2TS4]|uniref:sensor histidine kinase n=1 Tax=Paenibacillus sp. J2TS4 TaxID=2807194 RepID=UPI001B1D8B70|nr:sensor histidine kinase [Paenibacillus sp. J2TS4]GIP31498.1 two-component sensor histidine kinase [Paenibacillus sp. J2TS4]
MTTHSKPTFKQKIFNKLLLTSSITIIVTVIVLIITITNYYSDIIIQREMNLNTRTLERVEDYFSNKESDINSVIRNLYNREDMIADIIYALHNGYEDYTKYRLDKFTESKTFIPSNINTYFNGLFTQDNDINAAALTSEDYPAIEYLFIYDNGRWTQSVVAERQVPETAGYQPDIRVQKPVERVLKDTIIKKVRINNPVSLKKIGELTIFYTTDGLEKIIKKKNAEVRSSFFLLDEKGKIVYSFNQGVPIDITKKVHHEINENRMELNGDTYYVNSLASMGEHTYVSVIPQKELNKLTFVRGTMWILIVLSTIIAILMTYTFMRNYSARIKQINATIHEVESGNLTVRIPESRHDDELATIAISFNSMLDELNDYIERYYIADIKQQQAELKALQSQINPHFLFNTLEVIRMAAVVDGSITSSHMIYHLSRLLRYTLESKEMVPLHEEIENTSQYLKLMKLQYPNKLQTDFQIPTTIESTPIQKLILQPIIENYVVHGFRKDQKDNFLQISARQAGKKIEIQVIDNGIGIQEKKLQSIQDHINNKEDVEMKSIGLKNVQQRLMLKHGKQYGISLKSNPGKETIVTILIPAVVNDDV